MKQNFHNGSTLNMFCYQFIVNINFTIVQIAGVQKDLQNAARTNNRSRVTRLKENLTSMEADKIQFTEKQEQDKCFNNPETGSFHSNVSHL